jgi:hypothetical protein
VRTLDIGLLVSPLLRAPAGDRPRTSGEAGSLVLFSNIARKERTPPAVPFDDMSWTVASGTSSDASCPFLKSLR